MAISTLTEQQKLKHPPFCEPAMTLFDAAVKIAAIDVNALAVVEDGQLVGIITDHDIIRCLADTGAEFHSQIVRSWMTEKVVTCTEETKLSTALNMMAGKGIRHLVVMDCARPKTVISSKELLTRIHENDALEINVLRDLARVGHASVA